MRFYKYTIAALMMLLAEVGFSSSEIKKEIPKFIPKGYVPFDTVYGDLNKDGLEDCAVIIKKIGKKGIVKDERGNMVDRNRRGIVVLFDKDGHYALASKNYKCFSSENEWGGVYFAPDLWLEIKKGKLYVHYGHGRYGYWYYTFRWKNSDFELIGYDQCSMYGPRIDSRVSINYLTNEKIVENNINQDPDSDEEVFNKTETKISVTKRRKLSEIRDFDELYLAEEK